MCEAQKLCRDVTWAKGKNSPKLRNFSNKTWNLNEESSELLQKLTIFMLIQAQTEIKQVLTLHSHFSELSLSYRHQPIRRIDRPNGAWKQKTKLLKKCFINNIDPRWQLTVVIALLSLSACLVMSCCNCRNSCDKLWKLYNIYNYINR